MSERDDKRKKFDEKPAKGKNFILPVIILLVVAAAAGGWLFLGGSAAGGPQAVTAGPDGTIKFAAADFADGKARFYRLQTASGPVDFFVVRSLDGVVRSAFDTCDVCYKARKGYRQEGSEMVCNNCDQRFRTDLINVVKGGCNPAPLQRQAAGGSIVIAAADVEQGAWYFKATN